MIKKLLVIAGVVLIATLYSCAYPAERKIVSPAVSPAGPDALLAKWTGYPCTNPFTMDINEDGSPEFKAIIIDDPATPDTVDATALYTFGNQLWAFVELDKSGERWEIKWIDPLAPEAWMEWLLKTISQEV